jgi:hypothetical protein
MVVIAGLPRDSARVVQKELEFDKGRRRAKYEIPPAPLDDWRALYSEAYIKSILRQVGDFITRYHKIVEATEVPTPRRIITLYVPSHDSERLLSRLDFFSYTMSLTLASTGRLDRGSSPLSWRHKPGVATKVVRDACDEALRSTNALQNEITDKRMSVLSLPARNFYYPDDTTPICQSYVNYARSGYPHAALDQLRRNLLPARFDRTQLDQRAFKGSEHSNRFYHDCRGRVFPPDLYHGRVRADLVKTSTLDSVDLIQTVLRQRYRFGVMVRHGELHFDVQYQLPRRLTREPMWCCLAGPVWVTGSHANVGVNDRIWAPDGSIQNRRDE